MSAVIVGYSRLMEVGGIPTPRVLRSHSVMLIAPLIAWRGTLGVVGAMCLAALFLLSPAAQAVEDTYASHRARMVEIIKLHSLPMVTALGRRHLDPRILEVMGTVPRHEFLPQGPSYGLSRFYDWLSGGQGKYLAYVDRPLPIGYGQTISQPFIVALMTDLAAPQPNHVVLEVGTGSGYQAAVLARLVRRVCTIEIIPELGASAAATLKRLKILNVRTRVGDGYHGWPDCGPFDSIVVTAAAGHVPPPLLRQLKPGGRLIIPVGGVFATQQLVLAQKGADGRVTTQQLLTVRFVPLVSKE